VKKNYLGYRAYTGDSLYYLDNLLVSRYFFLYTTPQALSFKTYRVEIKAAFLSFLSYPILSIPFRNLLFTRTNGRYRFFENSKAKERTRFAPLTIEPGGVFKVFGYAKVD